MFSICTGITLYNLRITGVTLPLLYKLDTSLRQTVEVGLGGVHLRERVDCITYIWEVPPPLAGTGSDLPMEQSPTQPILVCATQQNLEQGIHFGDVFWMGCNISNALKLQFCKQSFEITVET